MRWRSHHVRWRAAVTGVSIALLATVSGCSSDASTITPTPTTSTPMPTSSIAWRSCGKQLDCATVTVPLDWANPGGATIPLSVIRHRASKPNQRIGTIFANPGGPGDTGVGLIRAGGDELDTWGEGRFDWISWDPRGTYGSSPVNCFISSDAEARFWNGATIPSTAAESQAFTERTTELARRCGEAMGPTLSHISTTDTVRDMEALRAQLGEETITYVGLSYGTLIGQMYASMFPEHVRAMMLDGIVDPVAYSASAESRVANSVSSTDEVFAQFLSTCDTAGPARCALAGHGESAASRVARLFGEVRKSPIPAPRASPPGVLTYGDLQVSSFAPLRDPALWPAYATQLNAAIEGDASALVTSARLSTSPAAWNEVTKSAAISCLDSPASRPVDQWPSVIGDLAKRSPLAGSTQGWWLWAPCASNWPAHSDDRFTGPWTAQTAAPILLIGTRYDPNTSYANAVRSERLLGNAVLLTHNGYGHLSTKDHSTCIEKWRVKYLVNLETPPRGTICQADSKPFFGE